MKKSSKVTLQDIAKRAKLSVSAVSLALRDHPSISESSKQRIAEIVKELGYRQSPKPVPNGHNRPILNIAYCLVEESLQDEAYVPIAHGIINACRKWEAHLTIQDIKGASMNSKTLKMPSGEEPSAYLLMGFLSDELVKHFQDTGKTVVVMGTNDLHLEVPVVRPDTLEAGRKIALRAIEDGYRSFIYITSNMTSEHNLGVLEGVRSALADHDLSLDERRVVVASEFEIHDTKHLSRMEKLTREPAALIAAGPTTAGAYASTFHAKGWMKDRQLSIYTLIPSKARRLNPLYNSLNMGLERIGEIAVDEAVQRILGYATRNHNYTILLSTLGWLSSDGDEHGS